MKGFVFNLCSPLIILFLQIVAGQNQAPPGARKPPFIVVPPEGERRGSASENIPIIANPDKQFVEGPFHQSNSHNVGQFVENSPSDVIKVAPLAPEVIKMIEQNLDRSCFNCLCQASGNCETRECFLAGPEQYYCGPYHISWAYWSDAGKPGDRLGSAHSFETCLKDFGCAERTIFGYMSKYAQDCNGDGRIDCEDFARIHKAGPHSCQGSWVQSTEYARTFDSCWNGRNNLNLRGGHK